VARHAGTALASTPTAAIATAVDRYDRGSVGASPNSKDDTNRDVASATAAPTTMPTAVMPNPSATTIDTIVRRVLEKLPDAVVRQAVAEIASTIAERVIREEIERIKAAIG